MLGCVCIRVAADQIYDMVAEVDDLESRTRHCKARIQNHKI